MGNKIYVGNLPFSATEEQLAEDFAQCGEITEVKLIHDRDTGRSKGFAFITFATVSAEEVVAQMNGQEYGGRSLKVSVAEDRPQRQNNFRNGGGGGRRNNDGYRGGRQGYGQGNY